MVVKGIRAGTVLTRLPSSFYAEIRSSNGSRNAVDVIRIDRNEIVVVTVGQSAEVFVSWMPLSNNNEIFPSDVSALWREKNVCKVLEYGTNK